MTLQKCPLCGAIGFESVFKADRVPTRHIRSIGAHDLRNDYGDLDIVCCNQCGHLFNSAFDNTSIEDLYQVHPSTNAPVHESMLKGLRDIASFILRQRTDRPKILEIGCGVGALAHLLALSAEQVDLVEPNLSLAMTNAIGDNVRLLPGFFPKASLGKHYDLIVCRQVLEHISDPIPFLESMRAHLANGGEIYLEVPDNKYILDNGSVCDLHYLHVHYFSIENLKRIFERVGLSVIESWSLKNGHDIGFLLKRVPSASSVWEAPSKETIESWGRLNKNRLAGQTNMKGLDGSVALYGASAYSQALLGMYPAKLKPSVVFDDTQSYAGHEAFCAGFGGAPVILPSITALSGIKNIIVCSYLHDLPISEKLSSLRFSGRLFTLRTDALSGKSGRPPSLFY